MISKVIKNRVTTIIVIFTGLFLLITLHLFFLQISKYSFFYGLGAQQYRVTLKTVPPRAPFYDRNGTLIATEKPTYSLFITPYKIKDHEELENFLRTYYPEAVMRLFQNKESQFMYVKSSCPKSPAFELKEESLCASSVVIVMNLLRRFFSIEIRRS